MNELHFYELHLFNSPKKERRRIYGTKKVLEHMKIYYGAIKIILFHFIMLLKIIFINMLK